MREEPGASEHSPRNEPPVVEPLFSYHAKDYRGFEECTDITQTESHSFFVRWRIIPQECLDSLIIMLGCVNRLEDLLIAIDQHIVVHLRDEIDREISIVTGRIFQQALLLFKPLIEPSAGNSI